MKSRGPYRRHSTPFKLQLCQDIRNGVIGRRDAQRTYGVSANLIQLWLTQFDRGELNDEEAEAIEPPALVELPYFQILSRPVR
ncbi:hypothetical protein [Rhizobium lusitanum]|jgi:transposase-like protein|uniref:hypothetical protein n=1 Tax=Rhizobium lusitanum TaxID=293958 RepID=UPI001FD13A84|nr:hypothetical protein [Rhizobium lusitanum]